MNKYIQLYNNISITNSKVILALVFLSGCIGLAYEIVYLNILSVYFYGDSWLINSSILIGVFAGLSIGSIFAGKIVRQLWLLEFVLGVLSLILGVIIKWQGLLLVHYIPEENINAILTAFMSGFIPLFIIGSHIPCYNMIIRDNNQAGKFTLVYAIYSIAAASAILFTAYLLIPSIGAVNCIILFGVINIILGMILMPTCKKIKTTFTIKKHPVTSLIILGAASTLWQSLFLDSSIGIYGYYNEIIILVIFVSILGNSIGSFGSYKIASPTVSIYGIMLCLFYYILIADTVILQSIALKEKINYSALIIGLMCLHGLMVFICFGALIPQLAHDKKNGSWVLGFFSLGNGIGIALHSLFLRGQHSLSFSIFCVVVLLFSYLFFKERSYKKITMHFIIAALVVGTGYYKYPGDSILLGINSRATMEEYEFYKWNLNNQKFKIENYSTVNNIVYAINNNQEWQIINNGYLESHINNIERAKEINSMAANFLKNNDKKIYIIGSSDGILLNAISKENKNTTVGEITPSKIRVN